MKTVPWQWDGRQLQLLDQRSLPHQISWVVIQDLTRTHWAIKEMVTRGAPLIGFTALWGMVMYLQQNPQASWEDFLSAGRYLATARPTAVNLVYEIQRITTLAQQFWEHHHHLQGFARAAEDFTLQQIRKMGQDNQTMAAYGLHLMQQLYGPTRGLNVLTICNTGALATGNAGTAFGVIHYLHQQGRIQQVYALETRPYLQGSRLTAWELQQAEIPYQLLCESAISQLLATTPIDAIWVGADRIVANGDTANKVGTASLSILAAHYQVPFFVVAPTSSFDLSLASGAQIEIEMRPAAEVTSLHGILIAPPGAHAFNPSFDVTLGKHITGIICEQGIISPVNPTTMQRQ